MGISKNFFWQLIGAVIVLYLIYGFFRLTIDLKGVISPFLASGIITYIIYPSFIRVRKTLRSKSLTALLMVGLIVLIVIMLLLIVIPMLIRQFSSFVQQIPNILDYIRHLLEEVISPFVRDNLEYDLNLSLDISFLREFITTNIDEIQAAITNSIPFLTSRGIDVILFVANVMLVPVLVYYFLIVWHRLVKFLRRMIPVRYRRGVLKTTGEIDEILSHFLRGQLIVMGIMMMAYGVLWHLVGLPNGLIIGMITGFLIFIPYVGAFIGVGLAVLTGILQADGQVVILILVTYLIAQTLESYLIVPYFMGDLIGLSQLEVIFAIMAFGSMMGITGIMLSLPVAAMIRVLFNRLVARYYQSEMYFRKPGTQ